MLRKKIATRINSVRILNKFCRHHFCSGFQKNCGIYLLEVVFFIRTNLIKVDSVSSDCQGSMPMPKRDWMFSLIVDNFNERINAANVPALIIFQSELRQINCSI